MNSSDIRKKYLDFFATRGHTIIPSASLVPENDPSVLFNTAGMQPLVPYLLGEKHPGGTRLANFQKCVRTGDIEEIGDNTHLTFFEMMGNWSLGDYFKEDAIQWSYELLTSKEEGFGLDPQRLYVTVFEGDENAPRDEESATIWKQIFERDGITGERVYFRPAKSNWWSPGPNGPCGPDTEMFYDVSGVLTKGMTLEEYLKADDEQRVVEIWNDVFMEYLSKDGKIVGKLEKKNVDTGSGFERVAMVLQGKDNLFETDIFMPTLEYIRAHADMVTKKSERIIADHVRTAVFLLSDGVIPSNKDQGYILRRIIRRAVRHLDLIGAQEGALAGITTLLINQYGSSYSNIDTMRGLITTEIQEEEDRFRKTLTLGLRAFEKGERDPFVLFTTYGFPLEMTMELAQEKGETVDTKVYEEKMKAHQDGSRAGAEGKFKGGLGDTSEMSLKYHTATHILHQALRDVLGDHVSQKGSNITRERLRFDFTHPAKMTDEEKKKVEDIVNEKIQADLPMQKVTLPKDEAEKTGALHFFGEKYGDSVTVYYIGDSLETAYSKEFCGGPHTERTGILGIFTIQKEEAVAQGVRRIKAVLT